MEEKALSEFPPSYDNLNFDGESEKLPSAPADGENSEFEGATEILEAPSAPPFVPNPEPRTLIYELPSLVFEDIYEACIDYVKEHCCYGSRFVREMKLTDIKNDSAFHYVLDTFCEKRESGLAGTPYTGQDIDGPENGPPPSAWDIPAEPPAMFHDGRVKLEIPHTAYVKTCDKCVGNGRVRCDFCSGRGGSLCFACGATGRSSNGACIFCVGTGRQRCIICAGAGQVRCRRCNGHGSIKCFKMLIVTWNTFSDEFMTNSHNLPTKHVKDVTGYKMLSEEQHMLTPIVNAPDDSVNAASRHILQHHRQAFRNMRILRQRHILRAVPLTKVFYEWRDKDGEFYVYGQEKKVYFQKYPQKCCCCTCL